MVNNVIVLSSLVVVSILFLGALNKSYDDIEKAKQVQESYDLLSQVKALIAKRYNKSEEDITRDDILSLLPDNTSFDKMLLQRRMYQDQDKKVTLDEKEKILLNKDAKVQISEKDKIALLALKVKLKSLIKKDKVEGTTASDNAFAYTILYEDEAQRDKNLKKAIDNTIDYLFVKYQENPTSGSGTSSQTLDNNKFKEEAKKFTPYNSITQKQITDNSNGNTLSTTDESQIKTKKEEFFQKLIIKEAKNSKDITRKKLYDKLVGFDNNSSARAMVD